VAAKNATRTIPVIMISAGDPVKLGLVESLARPGGNVRGLSYSVGVETFGKSLELLKEAVPKVRRVAILSNPANPAHALVLRNMKAVAGPMRVELLFLETRAPNEFDGAFAAMTKERVDALLVVADSLFNLHRTWLAEHAAKYRLPSMYGIKENVEPGGLMSYGPNLPEFYRRSERNRLTSPSSNPLSSSS
jgi:putative tryptophan/tyrosine transport system substrate-binding protein